MRDLLLWEANKTCLPVRGPQGKSLWGLQVGHEDELEVTDFSSWTLGEWTKELRGLTFLCPHPASAIHIQGLKSLPLEVVQFTSKVERDARTLFFPRVKQNLTVSGIHRVK
jgi:hypothetical protein